MEDSEIIGAAIGRFLHSIIRKKTEGFHMTFERNGLGIYPDSFNGGFFYTFGTAEHFYEFVCGENEAFIFYPEGHFK
ncbi:MAG: hypothetical protein IKK47_05595 [Ruminococcus sp.]|nr:hypothetical protein [Ruminococcus sp.]